MERCHAGGALRPLLMVRLRGQARRERQPLALGDVGARLAGGVAVAGLLLLSLIAAVGQARPGGLAVEGVAFEGAALLEEAPIAAELAPAVAVELAPAAAAVEVAPEATVVSLRLVEPQPIPVTLGELYQALARSNWPRELWPQVARIAQCEARWGSGVDAAAEGDSGRALGVLQIRVDAHRELARDFNLLTIDGALGAAWVVFQRAGYSFAPWSCA